MRDMKFISAMIDGQYLDHPSLNCTPAALGRDRVMFGADFPFESTEAVGHFIDTVPIAEDLRADICGNNAKKYIGL